MITLHINSTFERYFGQLDWGQEQELKRRLKADPTKEPIFYWHNPESGNDEILDGHHRYKIAKELKIDLEVHQKHFTTIKEAEMFIIRTQTTRRNIDNWQREALVKRAVELQMEIEGKTKTQAVKDVADEMGISERTAWEDVKPVNPIEAYKEAKAQFEKKITTVKNKAAEKLRREIVKDGLDEDAAMSQWEGIEAEIDEQHKDEIAELESLAEAAQQAGENNPGARSTGGKRSTKKSVRDRASRRNTFKKALSLISKLRNEAFYFWEQNGCGSVDVKAVDRVLSDLVDKIEAEQKADAAKEKKKFGR